MCNGDVRRGIEEEIFETIMTKDFPFNIRYQTTDPESSEDTKQDKYKKTIFGM